MEAVDPRTEPSGQHPPPPQHGGIEPSGVLGAVDAGGHGAPSRRIDHDDGVRSRTMRASAGDQRPTSAALMSRTPAPRRRRTAPTLPRSRARPSSRRKPRAASAGPGRSRPTSRWRAISHWDHCGPPPAPRLRRVFIVHRRRVEVDRSAPGVRGDPPQITPRDDTTGGHRPRSRRHRPKPARPTASSRSSPRTSCPAARGSRGPRWRSAGAPRSCGIACHVVAFGRSASPIDALSARGILADHRARLTFRGDRGVAGAAPSREALQHPCVNPSASAVSRSAVSREHRRGVVVCEPARSRSTSARASSRCAPLRRGRPSSAGIAARRGDERGGAHRHRGQPQRRAPAATSGPRHPRAPCAPSTRQRPRRRSHPTAPASLLTRSPAGGVLPFCVHHLRSLRSAASNRAMCPRARWASPPATGQLASRGRAYACALGSSLDDPRVRREVAPPLLHRSRRESTVSRPRAPGVHSPAS